MLLVLENGKKVSPLCYILLSHSIIILKLQFILDFPCYNNLNIFVQTKVPPSKVVRLSTFPQIKARSSTYPHYFSRIKTI